MIKVESFARRHIGPNEAEKAAMLKAIGVSSLDQLIDETVPANIRMKEPMSLPDPMTEQQFMAHVKTLASKNQLSKTYIGLGYHPTVLPGPIQRNILENPGWYTAYTPYQAEIAQGRLEALLNFQTMILELTGMEIANSSLLDEGTAAAEAMGLLFSSRSRDQKKANANKFFVANACLPQTKALLETRAIPLGIELVFGDHTTFEFNAEVFGALVQYPTTDGKVESYADFVKAANAVGAKVAVAADIMSLVLLTPPGEWGADVVVGTSQRFGIPMGYGGPHAAFFATKDEYKRNIPGRIIGVSQDKDGNPALRMALQTREQHIKREKATSNICTAQVLLAVMAGMYGVYHGPAGLKNIASRIHLLAGNLAKEVKTLGYKELNVQFFDTIKVDLGEVPVANVQRIAKENNVNFLYNDDNTIGISINETTDLTDLRQILSILAEAKSVMLDADLEFTSEENIDDALLRKDNFMDQKVFNQYHSETDLMRYIKKLERKDLSLNHSMIPLGSCTMKLNAATELLPLSWPSFGTIHPFVPVEQAAGYHEMFQELEESLCEITGFDAMSLQPNSGAQGEYAGLMVIRAYHIANGDTQRDVCLIPSSAHGTNPASAAMAGMKIVVVKCDESGNVDVDDLRAKAEQYSDVLSCLMVTYPSTHGVYEESIIDITDIIHKHGGQVYMDGANMNAQVGLTSPGLIGADVCHLNLHKTFAIPHGGGGPGMGPIGVKKHLAPFLPGSPVLEVAGGESAITPISAAPYGSSLVLLISYAYIKMLGTEGLTDSTKYAILNANYIKARLNKYYDVLYTGANDRVAHEMILECRPFKKNGIEVTDIAKRLMDYGFHAPTVSFPVAGTLMVEPTESESQGELDRFCDAMISIKEEIEAVVSGTVDAENNVLKNAPHTMNMLTSDEWNLPYTRQQAAYPLSWIADNKFWPSVRRVDDAYGDRNLVCSCEPIESYMDEAMA